MAQVQKYDSPYKARMSCTGNCATWGKWVSTISSYLSICGGPYLKMWPLQSVPVKGGLIWKCPYERVQSQARALLAPRAKQAGCWLPKSEPGWCRGCTTLWSTGRPATASACLELILSTVTSALQPKLERDLISSLHQSYQTKHLSEVIGPRMPFT